MVYIRWEEFNSDISKAFNQKGVFLGHLSWENIGQYRHWCWYQSEGIKMSPGCLEEVRKQQKHLWQDRRFQEKKVFP